METNFVQNSFQDFDLSMITEGLSSKASEILDILDNNVFYISDYNPNQYDILIDTLIRNMAEGFEHQEFRRHPVQYKFHRDDKKEEVKWLQFNHFIINVIFWRPAVCLDKDYMGDHLIVDANQMKKLTVKFIKKYMDTHYILRYNRFIPSMPDLALRDINHTLNEIIADTNYQLCKIPATFAMFIGISSSIETFKDLADRYPEINDLLHYKVDETLQPAEIEQRLTDAQKRLYQLIDEDEQHTMLQALIQPGAGLKAKQVKDMVINIGLKPDESGSTISHPINTNYLAGGGLKTLFQYYANAIPGRKAQILNNEFMGKSGHLLILVCIATARAVLSETEMDCDTVNPIAVELKNETYFNKMIGRRYRRGRKKEYEILRREDTHLIGETLYFRSPITCACKDGICRECYGELYYTNIDNNNQGIYSATVLMNPVVQEILSAKHHQGTNSSLIDFGEGFYQFFNISSTDIVLADEIDNVLAYSLLIRRDQIQTTDGEETEIDFNTSGKRRRKKKKKSTVKYSDNANDVEVSAGDESDEDDEFELSMPYYTTTFEVVKHLHSKNDDVKKYYVFKDYEEKELFMHTDFIAKMTPGKDDIGEYLYIDFTDINPDEFIFVVDVQNNELTRPMKAIQKLLNNKDHEGCNSFEELVNKMLDLMVASGLSATSVHAEMIIRQLIVDSQNILKRPDFSRIIMRNDYDILTIGSALKKNPSITTSLSTPYLKSQLIDLSETFDKRGKSVLDPLFKKTLTPEKNVLTVRENKYQKMKEAYDKAGNI